MEILDLFAALGIATLSGMGVGSGGLLVIYLTLLREMGQLAAQGMNLLFFLFSSSSSLLIHAFRRRLRINLIVVLTLSGMVGSWFGAALAPELDPALLRRLFGGMLTLSGLIVLFRPARTPSQD